MCLKQNTIELEKKTIKIVFPDIGYPLKAFPLKRWIYDHCLTQEQVADILGLLPEDFKRRLKAEEKFYEWEIRPLTYLMGAREAFKVIYFPTKGIRKKVWMEVFGKYEEQEKLNE